MTLPREIFLDKLGNLGIIGNINQINTRRKQMIISSQRYLDDSIVQIKRAARDYVVTVSPEFEIDGVVVHAVIDGHHSLAAAKADGVAPEFVEATVHKYDRIALLNHSVDHYLAVCYVDSDWYDIATGEEISW